MGLGIPTDLHRDLPVQMCLALDLSLAPRRGTREHWHLFAAALISVPFDLDDDWTVISRTILPLVSQRDIFPGAAGQSGIVDVVQAAYRGPVGRWLDWRGAQAAGAVCLWRSRQPPVICHRRR